MPYIRPAIRKPSLPGGLSPILLHPTKAQSRARTGRYGEARQAFVVLGDEQFQSSHASESIAWPPAAVAAQLATARARSEHFAEALRKLPQVERCFFEDHRVARRRV